MKTIIVTITILLSATLEGRTQYVYWNEITPNQSNLMNVGALYLEHQNESFLNLGFYLGNVNTGIDSMGLYWNRYSEAGFLEEEGYTRFNYTSYISANVPHASYLHLGSNNYLITRAIDDAQGDSFPYLILVDENLDTVWTKLYNAQPTATHNSWYPPYGTLELDNNEFLTLTTACDSCIYNNNGFRFIRMNTLGETLSDTQWASDNHWHSFNVNGFTRYGADSLLFWGSVVHFAPGAKQQDRDVFIAKSDLAGGGLQWTQIGNSNLCDEGPPDGILMENGHLLFLYGKCFSQDEFITYIQMVKLHSVEFDPESMAIVNENPIDMGVIDDVVMQGIYAYRIIKVPYGGYLAHVQHAETNSVLHYYLMKLDDTFELEWFNEYFCPQETAFRNIYDVINAPDGGFVGTGIAEYYSPWLVQRSWTFKIDACGYEQPMGCAAVIGVDEKQNNNIAIWPNPFRGELKAILPKSAKRVFITDLTGRCVHEEKVYYPNQQWNFSSLSDGIYMLNVEVENGEVIGKKIIKQ